MDTKYTHARMICGQVYALSDGFLEPLKMSEKVTEISFERMKGNADIIELCIATDRYSGDFEVSYDLPDGVELRYMADCLVSLAHHIYKMDTH